MLLTMMFAFCFYRYLRIQKRNYGEHRHQQRDLELCCDGIWNYTLAVSVLIYFCIFPFLSELHANLREVHANLREVHANLRDQGEKKKKKIFFL